MNEERERGHLINSLDKLPKPSWKMKPHRPRWQRQATNESKLTQSLVLTAKEYGVSGDTAPETVVSSRRKSIALDPGKKPVNQKNLKL